MVNRWKCRQCRHRSPRLPPAEAEFRDSSKAALIPLWSLVGVFAIGCVLFLVWRSNSAEQAAIAAANGRISQAVPSADEWLAGASSLDGEAVEQQLLAALGDEHATATRDGESMLSRGRDRRGQLAEQARLEEARRQADAIFAEANREIDERRVTEAIALLRKYIDDPNATKKPEAEKLLAEAKVTVSGTQTFDAQSGFRGVGSEQAWGGVEQGERVRR